ncbi:MAG: TlpA disulfide reductase family protein [Betaproteobacteria bacterium]|nr:TlpA disulfide reductase family protein [Betaproteobacteria bacterium]
MLKRVLAFIVLATVCASAWSFDVTDTQGHRHTLADYKGKWVLVNFWATWCPPCRAEIPDLIALHNQYRNSKLEVLGIAMEYNDPNEVTRFAQSMHISYPIVLGNDAIASQIGQVQGLPTSYLYNPQGKIVAYQVGALTREAVEHYINTSHAPAAPRK